MDILLDRQSPNHPFHLYEYILRHLNQQWSIRLSQNTHISITSCQNRKEITYINPQLDSQSFFPSILRQSASR